MTYALRTALNLNDPYLGNNSDIYMSTMNKGRQVLYSDSDIPQYGRLESIGDFISSRRGSLSDLVFSGQRKLSRDSVYFSNKHRAANQLSHHLSLDCSSLNNSIKDSCSNSLLQASGSCLADKKAFLKTKSSRDVVQFAGTPSTGKRNSKELVKTPLLLKRRRSMRKIQSLKTFEGLLGYKRKRNQIQVI